LARFSATREELDSRLSASLTLKPQITKYLALKIIGVTDAHLAESPELGLAAAISELTADPTQLAAGLTEVLSPGSGLTPEETMHALQMTHFLVGAPQAEEFSALLKEQAEPSGSAHEAESARINAVADAYFKFEQDAEKREELLALVERHHGPSIGQPLRARLGHLTQPPQVPQDPGTPNQPLADAEASQPETGDLATRQPEPTDLETAQPQHNDWGATQPQQSDPAMAQPQQSDPAMAQPQQSDPAMAQPQQSDPAMAQPGYPEPQGLSQVTQGAPPVDFGQNSPSLGQEVSGDPGASEPSTEPYSG
jgi:hypothetical protein